MVLRRWSVRDLFLTVEFWSVFAITGVLLQIPLLLVWPVLWIVDRPRLVARSARARWATFVMRLCFPRLRIEGLENLPEDRAFIIAPNHRSNIDAMLLMMLGQPVLYLAKASVLLTPVIGWWALFCSDVMVVRRHANSRRRSLALMARRVLHHIPVVVFPEGTRRKTDVVLGPLRNGAFSLAVQYGVTIVPVAILGSDDVWRPRRRMLTQAPMTVRILPALRPAGHTVESLREQVRDALTCALTNPGSAE